MQPCVRPSHSGARKLATSQTKFHNFAYNSSLNIFRDFKLSLSRSSDPIFDLFFFFLSLFQEVLLAHSKTSTHCEPITVILAGVEAPELAAILGFVYTGSATVPRPRLNAFLHAAEALHIALPPVPLVMTCAQSECKQEDDFKDVKINPKYLRRDQYPCCARCFHRPRSINQDEDPAGKREPYPAIESLETGREIGPLPESMNFAGSRYGPSKYCSTTSHWPVPPPFASVAREKMAHGVDQHSDKGKERTSEPDAARYRPISVVARIDRVGDVPTGNRHWENHHNGCDFSDKPFRHRGVESLSFSYDPSPRDGGSEQPEARMRNARIGDEEDALGGNDLSTYGDCNSEQERIHEDRLSVIRSRIDASAQIRAVSSGSYERADHGEDLTCREGCFAWRSPRRQVANRVIDSPWKQTVKPYHLPKVQPMALLQPHAENVVSVLLWFVSFFFFLLILLFVVVKQNVAGWITLDDNSAFSKIGYSGMDYEYWSLLWFLSFFLHDNPAFCSKIGCNGVDYKC